MIQTILFDWDGTLLNSNDLINQSNIHALNQYCEHQYTEDEVKPFNGPPLIQVYKEIYPEKAEEILAAYRAFNGEHHDEMVHLFPNVVTVLRALKTQHITLGVVSTKRRKMVIQGIELFHLSDVFDVVIGGDSCSVHKPHGDPILQGMKEVQAEKATTIMVGDNWQDIEAANNAGIRSVFVEWSQKSLAEMKPYNPTATIQTMNQLLALVKKENNEAE